MLRIYQKFSLETICRRMSTVHQVLHGNLSPISRIYFDESSNRDAISPPHSLPSFLVLLRYGLKINPIKQHKHASVLPRTNIRIGNAIRSLMMMSYWNVMLQATKFKVVFRNETSVELHGRALLSAGVSST